MKLSTFAIALTLSVASVQAFAQNVILNPVNDSLETQVCYTAATESLTAAKKLARSNGVKFSKLNASVSCNGLSISEFAKTYANNVVTEDAITIKLVAAAGSEYLSREMSAFIDQFDSENSQRSSLAED